MVEGRRRRIEMSDLAQAKGAKELFAPRLLEIFKIVGPNRDVVRTAQLIVYLLPDARLEGGGVQSCIHITVHILRRDRVNAVLFAPVAAFVTEQTQNGEIVITNFGRVEERAATHPLFAVNERDL